MLHPVLPPEPPSILEKLEYKGSSISRNDISTMPIAKADTKAQIKKYASSRKVKSTSFAKSGKLKDGQKRNLINPNLVAQTPALPTEPENFPPEFSPTTPILGASALGSPLSVGNIGDKNHPEQNSSSQAISSQTTSSQTTSSRTINNSNKVTQNQESIRTVKKTDSFFPAEKLNSVRKQTNNLRKNSNIKKTSNSPLKKLSSSTKIQVYPRNQAGNNRKAPVIRFKARQQTIKLPKRFTISQEQPTPPQPGSSNNNQIPLKTGTPETRRVIEVIADKQEYDEQRRIITAQGNVIVRFDGAVVDADRLQVNLDNLIAVGQGDVALTRGDQVLRGQRFTYNFIQDSGELDSGSGEIFIPTANTDLAFPSAATPRGGEPPTPLSDRIRRNQPLTGVGSPGGITIGVGSTGRARNLPGTTQGGQVQRLRFKAEKIDFYPRGFQARNVRITNDPFSPPELELRANTVTLTRETPLRDRIRTKGQRLVFDQGFSLPIPRNSQVIDRNERDATPAIVSFGFDGDRRGGLFLERKFQPIIRENFSLSLTPQFFVQEAVQRGTSNLAGLFGLKTRLRGVLDQKTTVKGSGDLTSFNLEDIGDNLRASLRLQRVLGRGTNVNPNNSHLLNLEYSYRDRLFNGTLGFQTVQSSLGGVITSPVIPLGNSGFNLKYQGGAQLIEANTDEQDLLDVDRTNNRVSLGRVQASAALEGGLLLWQGKGLPPTADKGLRYTANPVVPYVRVTGGVRGVSSFYTNGDSQNVLIGSVGLQGQFGNFSRPAFDYTAFNISYSQGLNSGLSPFLFDRFVDNRVLNLGITQQLYGPFRLGVQTSINIRTGESRSTDYILEYSRRTYGISLRYNPVLELGGVTFRISDFNWTGGTDPFSD